MKQADAVVVAALALVGAGAVVWLVLAPPVRRAADRPAAAAAGAGAGAVSAPVAGRVVSPPGERPAVPLELAELPPEPAPPPPGAPDRRPYFEALAAGEERSLATVRAALAAALDDQGGAAATTPYVRTLKVLEAGYAERLARHRAVLAAR
jgi:hypothetical protein